MRRLAAALVVIAALVAGAAQAAAGEQPAVERQRGAPGVAPVDGSVLRGFEPPAHPYGPGHRGVALAAAPGEPAVAALPGRVRFAGTVAGVGWVTVSHGGGLETTYGPLDPRAVAAGEAVARAQLLGQLAPGATHLHWGARLHGAYIDPLLLLQRWEVHLVAAQW